MEIGKIKIHYPVAMKMIKLFQSMKKVEKRKKNKQKKI